MTNRNNARMIAKFIRMVWGGSPAVFASDGLFSFGAHPEGE